MINKIFKSNSVLENNDFSSATYFYLEKIEITAKEVVAKLSHGPISLKKDEIYMIRNNKLNDKINQ